MDKVIKALDENRNVLLCSAGGTGKTYLLKEISSYLIKDKKTIHCAATTGIAAINLNNPDVALNGTTLHSFFGVGLASETKEKLYEKVNKNMYAKLRLNGVNILIIDEISMWGLVLFEKLDYIAKKIRRDNKPFGGIQLILSGDYLQLPPVKDSWIFNSDLYKELDLVPVILTEPKRFTDLSYFELLQRVRFGELTKEDSNVLSSRNVAYKKLVKELRALTKEELRQRIQPTILYSRKADVSAYNEKQLKKLPEKSHTFVAKYKYSLKTNRKINTDVYIKRLEDAIPDKLELKVGSQVMLKVNLDLEKGFVNGSRGIITGITPEHIEVKFMDGKIAKIESHPWIFEDDLIRITKIQIPLILAWALTTHKSQGCTLDYVVCDLGSTIFEDGQAYVALSRVRNLDGLYISNFLEKSIHANREAIEYMKSLS